MPLYSTHGQEFVSERAHDIFWAEIAPREHLVQVYPDEHLFLESLERFVVGGLRKGESVIVIATSEHRKTLEERLEAYGTLASARRENHYISLDAAETLSRFMVDGWPDATRFRQLIDELLLRAGANERRIRAFGEMVALMWAQGHNGATVRLEHLWHEVCESMNLSLFCAYPQSGFTQDALSSIKEICSLHTKIVKNQPQASDRRLRA